ncbi:MAG TPA: ATP-binding protein [Usitatibacter sp.]|nr:ATP-binding protein [Usitatibacter sp.]
MDRQFRSPPQKFNLTRRFSILSLVCVVAVAGVLGQALARMLADRLLNRDAVVTMEFVQSIVRTDATAPYFPKAGGGRLPEPLEDTLKHFGEMPDVLRANVYTRERSVLWSTDPALVGRKFDENDELDDALEGKLVYKSGRVSKEEHKAGSEHPLGSGKSGFFVEIYVPVRDPTGGHVIGVVELYKTPDALFEAIRDGQEAVALGAAIGGLLLYLALIGIVRQADAIMRDQQRRLVEGERLAIVGEMASAVAHSIRNPLSSIRTSVELALDRDPGRFREPADDIVAEVDKIEAWIRELLAFTRPGSIKREAVDVNQVVRASLASVESQLQRKRVDTGTALAEPAPTAMADVSLLQQVLQSILTNAMDALPDGGKLEVKTAAADGRVNIVVHDHGTGIGPDHLEEVFKPFFTTKPRGIGLGLPLARRLVERMGGSLTLASKRGEGTSVHIELPA